MRLSRRRRIQSPQPEQLEQRALLTAGDVLTSFGQNGFLELPGGQQPIVQPDGKTVTVGYDNDLQQIVLTRFESDGALDLSFGSNGRALIPGGGSTFTTLATEMADGSILVWSQGRFQINQASTAPRFVQVFGFYRLSADGQLDSSFGDGGFLVQAGFTGRRVLRDLTATPDGKVLGTFLEEPPSGSPDASDRPALIRFNSDGTIDQSFGNHGIAELGETIDIGGRNVMRTVLQPDGKTLIAANEFVNTPTFNDDFLNVIVMRANADGSVDTTFGDDGRSIFRIGSGYGDEVVDLHLRSDGKIVVVAQNEPSRSSTAADLAFARLTPDGQLDTSFSGDGKLVVFNTSGVSGSFISDNDKITTIDTLSERVELQRFNSDGTPDVSFGTNGIATLTGEYGGPLYELPDTTIIATVAFFASGPDGVVAFEGDGGSGAFQFDAESIAIDEAAGSATVLVTRRNGTDGRATVIAETTTSGSSATAGDDYVETSETLVFENGESVKTITVPIVDSVPTEGTESISLRLRQPTDGSSLGTQSTSRIDIIDQAGTINFAEAVYLAQESLPTGTLTFTRTDGFAGTIQADIRVVGGSATAGLDFETPTQRVRFTDGQRTATIDITMLDDDLEEGPEFATLELINPTNGAAIGSGTARLQILDAEAGVGQNPGALDRHFGVDGQVVAELDGSQFTTSMARQPDGKIVVAGSHTPVSGNGEATSREFGLTRFNEEGSIDTSFGIDGLASVGFGGDASDLINDIALQQDGKIVAVGTTEDGLSRFAIARFNADGTLDTSFGDDGLITEDFENFASANAVAIDSEGRIIVVGSTGDVFSHGFAIARYQPNGRLDTSFGEGGLVTTNIEINTLGRGPILGQFSTASDVAILADDRIVVGGTQESAQAFDRSILSVANFVFAQYNVDGTLDPTFGFDGIILHDTNGGVEPDDGASNNADRLNTMEVDSEGRIIAAGQSDGDFVVARFRPDGQIDESFGFLSGFQATGIQQASTGFQFRDEVNAVGFLPDGDLILVGQASFSRFGAVRLQENGFYQESFGADAVVQHSISRAIDTTVLPDGRVLSAVQTPGDFGLAQIITETDCPLAGCVQFATVGFVANEDSGTATITVSRDPRTTAGAVTVDYAAVAGTATADEDFIETSGTLSFADGQQSATFEVELIDDDISEGTVRGFGTRTDETVQLSLSNPTGGAFLGSTNVVQLAIVDDEQPELDFGIFTSAVQENAGVAVVTVTRRQLNGIAPDEPASVDFTVIDGTATAGLDFEPLLGTISFAPQQETATIEIPLIADTEIEGEEAFTVQLSNPQGGLLRRGDTATVRLLDTDPTTFENAGQLWRPFGNDGIIRQGFNGSPEYVNDAVQLEDGSVLVAARLGDVSDFEILKYNPDGSLDTDFGQFGRAEKYDQRERNEAQAVRVLDDGKIMAAGYSWDGLVRSFVLVRYNADGTLDETFGNEGVQFHTIAWWASSFDDVKIGSDGSVWFNGSIRDSKDSGSTNAIVRFGSDGEVDPQFGDDGVIYVAQAFGIRFPSTAAANDGGLLLLGAGEGTTELIKINEQGLLDTSFGDNGFASYPDIDGVFSSSSVLQVLPDGSVLSDRQAFSEDFTEVIQRLVKFLPNGEPDDAFGDGGLAEWNAPLRVEGVAVEADGRIVLSGQALGSSAAYRIYPNGDRDTGFGQDGLTVIAQSGSAERVFVAEDGRLLLIGETSNDLLLAQLRGGPDPGSFQFDSGQFEISEAAGSITIPVQRVAGADGTVRVTVRTRESDSAVEGRDYEGVTQTLRFEDRQLTSEITIPITDDDAAEGNLSFIVELINPTNDATLNALSSAEVTIIDDESPGKFQFTSSSEFVGEGEGTAAITVERISGNGGRATVQVVSADGSA
ncbi:MAG: Calx-beta domain-containing protein, partial [Planctomycetaceae bacterium]